MQAPNRIDPRNTGSNLLQQHGAASNMMGMGTDPSAAQWIPIALPVDREVQAVKRPPITRDYAVQTVGIFYPSSKELSKTQHEVETRFKVVLLVGIFPFPI